MEKRGEMVRPQDERTGRQTLTDDTAKAILMDMCPDALARHLMLNANKFDTFPKVRFEIRDYVERIRRKGDPMENGVVRGPRRRWIMGRCSRDWLRQG